MTIKGTLKELARWAESQRDVRLTLGPPLDVSEIDRLPGSITRLDTADRYDPKRFIIRNGYREFLTICSFAKLEFRETGAPGWYEYQKFLIYSPEEIAEGRAWIPAGEYLDDEEELSTTEFIAFADGGLNMSSNYWCFYTGEPQREDLPIYFLDNDHELLIAKYAGTEKWIDDKYKEPSFPDFQSWLCSLVEWVVSEPFDLLRPGLVF